MAGERATDMVTGGPSGWRLRDAGIPHRPHHGGALRQVTRKTSRMDVCCLGQMMVPMPSWPFPSGRLCWWRTEATFSVLNCGQG